jgi:hypothetical protein
MTCAQENITNPEQQLWKPLTKKQADEFGLKGKTFLLTESIRTKNFGIDARKKWGIFLIIHKRFSFSEVPMYAKDIGLTTGECMNCMYFFHTATSEIFILGTRFCEWRIWGPAAGRSLIPDFCKWIGPDFMPHLQNHKLKPATK